MRSIPMKWSFQLQERMPVLLRSERAEPAGRKRVPDITQVGESDIRLVGKHIAITIEGKYLTGQRYRHIGYAGR